MDKFEIKLKCLEISGGGIRRAEELYNWIVGNGTEPEDASKLDIRDEGLSSRARNCCLAVGIKTVLDLSQMTSSKIRRVRNLGQGTYDELARCLQRHGLNWADKR